MERVCSSPTSLRSPPPPPSPSPSSCADDSEFQGGAMWGGCRLHHPSRDASWDRIPLYHNACMCRRPRSERNFSEFLRASSRNEPPRITKSLLPSDSDRFPSSARPSRSLLTYTPSESSFYFSNDEDTDYDEFDNEPDRISNFSERPRVEYPAMEQRISHLESLLRGQANSFELTKEFLENELTSKNAHILSIKKENEVYTEKVRHLENELRLAVAEKFKLQEIVEQKRAREEQMTRDMKKMEEDMRVDTKIISDLKRSLDKEISRSKKLLAECESLKVKMQRMLDSRAEEERFGHPHDWAERKASSERQYREANRRMATEMEKTKRVFLDKESQMSKTIFSIEDALKKKDKKMMELSDYLTESESKVNELKRELEECVEEVRNEREEKKSVEARYIYHMLEVNVELKETKEALQKCKSENEQLRSLVSSTDKTHRPYSQPHLHDRGFPLLEGLPQREGELEIQVAAPPPSSLSMR